MHPLEEYRKNNNLTMQEMCDRIGCKLSPYKSWIYGWKFPSARNLLLIKEAVDISADRLLKAYEELQESAA
ncbi:Helix-turn-helix domain protein [Labrenzia sp. THAF191b]|uniref:helix-turn-helix domain-containing protein n=1 Tax=unclassified Labrenzia TaxID=2648686 RepID=UPI0012692D9A|nr:MULTISPECIES: helix-turn-helix transcriptional regulator [unclassified Labrenzia]QFS98867.1 Helix-turn-helix domain protein [Labrenzia sp. THAF191b]QFT05181.1 Helix-turn-helix domain protein [Labrenzia sp. THAF191a]QFT16725.1 Helix-turn-helix domain protein [Labrenzia sp. THAF187b]